MAFYRPTSVEGQPHVVDMFREPGHSVQPFWLQSLSRKKILTANTTSFFITQDLIVLLEGRPHRRMVLMQLILDEAPIDFASDCHANDNQRTIGLVTVYLARCYSITKGKENKKYDSIS